MKTHACICAADLGRRAARLRDQRGISLGEVARLTGAKTGDIERFEQTGEGSVDLLLALSAALSSGDEISQMLTIPKFDSLDDVETYESRRTAAE